MREYVYIIQSEYDSPEAYGPFEDEEQAARAAHLFVTGEQFAPGGDYETLFDWYCATDAVSIARLYRQ